MLCKYMAKWQSGGNDKRITSQAERTFGDGTNHKMINPFAESRRILYPQRLNTKWFPACDRPTQRYSHYRPLGLSNLISLACLVHTYDWKCEARITRARVTVILSILVNYYYLVPLGAVKFFFIETHSCSFCRDACRMQRRDMWLMHLSVTLSAY